MPAGACNIAESFGDKGGISFCLIEASLKICRHFLRVRRCSATS